MSWRRRSSDKSKTNAPQVEDYDRNGCLWASIAALVLWAIGIFVIFAIL